MNALVVYDSNYGNTKKIAQEIAHVLHGKAIHVLKVTDEELDDADELIVGSPINGWKPTEKINNYLNHVQKYCITGMKAAAFDTRLKMIFHGDAAGKISKVLKNAGAQIVASPQGFFVNGKEGPLLDGEIERAKEWTRHFSHKLDKSNIYV